MSSRRDWRRRARNPKSPLWWIAGVVILFVFLRELFIVLVDYGYIPNIISH